MTTEIALKSVSHFFASLVRRSEGRIYEATGF
jgi:hypothetical protein